MKVLIAECDNRSGKSLKKFLEDHMDAQIHWVRAANAAMNLAPDSYTLILISYRLVGMNGVELVRQLREQHVRGKIIGMSFRDKGDDFDDAGADAFFPKRKRRSALLKLISETM